MDAAEFSTWRKRVGITQEELAERWAGVTRNTVQNWESGATAIPAAVASACSVWERRLKQENPVLGPVTLIYADGPMFVDPYRPRRLAMMRQEPFRSNPGAIARVIELWGRDDFHNAFIIEQSGGDLWNAVELGRVVTGQDESAATVPNLLSHLAKYIRATASIVVRSGPRLATPKEANAHQARIEFLATKLDRLAVASRQKAIRYLDVEDILTELRNLGKHPPDQFAFDLADAFAGRDMSNPYVRPERDDERERTS
jgi:hypothetical protein